MNKFLLRNKKIAEWIEHYHLFRLGYILFVFVLVAASFSQIFPHYFQLLVLASVWIPVAWEAIKGLKEKKFGSELFFVLAAIVALLGDEERAITIVLLVVMIANYIERLVEERTEHAIESLVSLIPTDVLVQKDGKEQIIHISQISVGMRIIVKTGSRIPVDGVIVDGEAAINEAPLTGEGAPKEKAKKDEVYAGSFVESGSIVIKAEKVGEDTSFGKIKKLLEKGRTKKAKVELLADKIGLILTPVLIVFIAGVWFVTRDLQVVITMLVFGSPIEVALVTPLAILAGIVAVFRYGILAKNGIALERFSKVDTMVFDKTGTLTIGEPKIVAIAAVDKKHSEDDIVRMAAITEKRSGHILAKAILAEARVRKIATPDPDTFSSVHGHGVEATYKGEHYYLGTKHYIEEKEHGNIPVKEFPKCDDSENLHTSFYLACGKEFCGMICVADQIRGDAKETIDALKKHGIKNMILLSGDRKEVVEKVASSLGIPNAYGEVLPDQKLEMIEKLHKEGHKVAMIGDGINDAPSLKRADVGIAMGAMGMEPAIEASDIALMSNDLSKIVFTYDVSKQVLGTIKQNIVLGLGFTHGLGMLLALLHILNPIQAAFFHAVPDLLILLNSGRLLRLKPKAKNFLT